MTTTRSAGEGLIRGMLAAALAGGLWLVSRRIGRKLEANEPLLITQVLARLGDKVDDLKDRFQQTEPPSRKAESGEK